MAGKPGFDALVEELISRLRGARRIVVLGIGSALRGDDAVGPRLARRLGRMKADGVMVLDCATSPECYTGRVKDFKADHVVLVDAVEAGLEPGGVVVLSGDQLSGLAYNAHRLPLRLLATYLKEELGAEVTLVGVQAKHLGLSPDVGLSKEVGEAVDRLKEAFEEVFRRLGRLKAGGTGRRVE